MWAESRQFVEVVWTGPETIYPFKLCPRVLFADSNYDLAAADRFMRQLNSIGLDMMSPRNQRKTEVMDKATGATSNAGAASLVVWALLRARPNDHVHVLLNMIPLRCLLRKVHWRINPDTVDEDAAISVYKPMDCLG
ncbi:Het domain-containing protein [Lasiodiplodia theobromae]|uniref:Het domain-containing protein n=1 Tax=Lasiodiplodia theobromae TaxID=45133 RepID=UPI0015C39651|nr:Het domain-containing protein [Lasiodiplodia theobromae]KAF4545530.1 Het domain-containing protein [Lasiodiplodia theobromae]